MWVLKQSVTLLEPYSSQILPLFPRVQHPSSRSSPFFFLRRWYGVEAREELGGQTCCFLSLQTPVWLLTLFVTMTHFLNLSETLAAQQCCHKIGFFNVCVLPSSVIWGFIPCWLLCSHKTAAITPAFMSACEPGKKGGRSDYWAFLILKSFFKKVQVVQKTASQRTSHHSRTSVPGRPASKFLACFGVFRSQCKAGGVDDGHWFDQPTVRIYQLSRYPM